MDGWFRNFTVTGLLAGSAMLTAAAQVMDGNSHSGIYSCIDSRGRKLTSDRPIAECVDREQVELNPSGTVRRRIGPSLTAAERAVQEARERQLIEEKARLAEEKRRNHALLIRYPSRAVHDTERYEALNQVDGVIKTARNRLVELQQQRKTIDAELEFYRKDPSKIPPALRRQVDENTQSTSGQIRFIGNQEEEKKRINSRFDEELVRLKQLWALQAPSNMALPELSRPVAGPAR